jgi:nicotinate-nucleotide adenylyltransferase
VSCIGLLGGTFDPPHVAHVRLAETAKRHFDIDPLRVLVAADPPHKLVSTPVEQRLGLARVAFPDDEVVRDDNPYSIDTVTGFGDDAIFLVGADQFAKFLTWRAPDEILEHVRLGVATRPGYPREQLDVVLSGLARPDRVEFFDLEPSPVSSSQIRARVGEGEPIGGLVPPAVAAEIGRLGLYRLDPGYSGAA